MKRESSLFVLRSKMVRRGHLLSAVLLAAVLCFPVFSANAAPTTAKAPVSHPQTAAPASTSPPSAGKEISVLAGVKRPVAHSARSASRKSTGGLKNFSPHVFHRELSFTTPPAALMPSSLAAASSVQGFSANPATTEQSSSLLERKGVTVTGGIPAHPESRMEVERTPLPGGRHTLSREESGTAPEMSMSVKMSRASAARFVLNPQDDTSPIYSPIVKESGLAATGIYLDLDVAEGVQVQFGGEVRSFSSESGDSTEEGDSAGASVGLRWNF
jgi:hypothetical protein